MARADEGGRRGVGGGSALLAGERPTAEALWLEALGRVAARGAHEIKGALNGVSVNLEVVRSRAAKAEAPASAVRRFAETAAEQVEALTRMSEALLALARPMREPTDVLVALRRLVALLAPATAAEGGVLTLEEPEEEPIVSGNGEGAVGASGASPAAVRLLLASALLEAIRRKGRTACRAAVGGAQGRGGLTVRVECAAGGAIELSPAVLDVASDAGIGVESDAEGITLAFPRPERGRETPTADRA